MNTFFRTVCLTSGLLFSLSFSSTTFAEGTPDGMTPAAEEICDSLTTQTPGLYGLCIAYCEATDGPSEVSTEEDIKNLPIPNQKILEAYNRKRDAEIDEEMPCAKSYDESACPVWTIDQLESIGSYEAAIEYNDQETGVYIGIDDPSNTYYHFLMDNDIKGYRDADDNLHTHARSAGIWHYGGSYYTGIYTEYKLVRDSVTGKYTYTETPINNQLILTKEQYDACFKEIKEHIVE